MASIRAVVFDLDDTLYPEREYVLSGFRAVAVALGDRLGPQAEIESAMRALFDSEHRARVFDRLLAERGVAAPEKLIADMLRVYRRHIPRIELFHDAEAALTRLRKRLKLGIISDGRMVAQALKIKVLDLRNRVDKIIVTSELGPEYAKPHPRAFEWMAGVLNVEHAECAYVADNPAKDFIAPNALGWTSVRILRDAGLYRYEQPPTGGEPHHVIATLDALDGVCRMLKSE